MVFMVLGRFETSQGLLCNLSGVPGTYENTHGFHGVGTQGALPRGPSGQFCGPRLVPGGILKLFVHICAIFVGSGPSELYGFRGSGPL